MNRTGKGYKFPKGSSNPFFTHGMTVNRHHSRVYSSWSNMVQRCTNPDSQDWNRYGARGITICGKLRKDPAALRKAIGDPPLGHTLNRIDNNGHYSCGWCGDCWEHGWNLNIEWSDSIRQSRNRGEFIHRITLNGETHCITEWAEILGVKARTIRGRVHRGWTDPQEILSTDLSTNRYKRK
jgi:hypothetical protein